MTIKDQERKALAEIRKIVDGLGADSYIAMAFDGCFEIAEENIENDFGCSMKDRAMHAEAEAAEYKAEYIRACDRITEMAGELRDASEKVDEVSEKLENCTRYLNTANTERIKAEARIRELNDEYNALQAATEAAMADKDQEIMRLKARLYDLPNA